MAKLIFLLDGNVIKEYVLDKERMGIGRRATNAVHIDNLAVSGEHAVIVTIGEDSFIEDLNSTNGTLVNGKQIKKQMLKHGDDIGLGKYKLRYIKDGLPAQQVDGAFGDTVLVTPQASQAAPVEHVEEGAGDDVVPVESSSSQTAAPAEAPVTAAEVPAEKEDEELGPRLMILSGDDAGSVLFLDKTMIKLGEPDKQLAVITKREDKHFITHVSGDNYPFVNGKRIGMQAAELSNQDEIEVLDIKMQCRFD